MRYNQVIFGMLAFVLVVVIGSAFYVFTAILHFETDTQAIIHEQQVLVFIEDILSAVKDVETGKRGYVLTGDESYLEPYFEGRRTLDSLFQSLPDLHLESNKTIHSLLHILVYQKLIISDSTIRLRREGGLRSALTVINSEQGKHLMDSIRHVCGRMQQVEYQKIAVAAANNKSSAWNTKLTIFIAVPTVILFLVSFALITKKLLTSREQMYQSSLEQKKFTESILETVPGLMLVFDIQKGGFKFVNTFFEKLLGYTTEEMMTLDESSLVTMIHPDDRAKLRITSEQLRISTDCTVYEREYRLRHKDGSWRCFADRAVVFQRDENGAVLQVLAFLLDITSRVHAEEEQKRSQILLHSVLNTSPYDIVVIEAARDEREEIIDFRYVLLNAVATKSAKRSLEEMQQHTMLQLYPFVVETGQYSRFCEVINSGENAIFEVHVPVNGVDTWRTNVCSKLNDGLVLITYDISERKAAEEQIHALNMALADKNARLEGIVAERTEQLQQSNRELGITNQQLEETNKELEAFSYSVSHDLRAPLRSVTGFAEVLRERYEPMLDEEGVRMLGRITNGAEKMGVLIDDLLSLSRLGRKTMQFSDVNMEALVRSVLAALNVHNELADYTIEIGDLPRIVCDAGLMRQVWENLISNAVKYSRNSSNKVISISAVSKPGSVEYAVRDTGVGFDMRYANKLFNVFQRLHKERDFEGTGVGLAIVKRVITKHGGQVYADAEINKGATFFISLPNNILPTVSTLIEENNYERS